MHVPNDHNLEDLLIHIKLLEHAHVALLLILVILNL